MARPVTRPCATSTRPALPDHPLDVRLRIELATDPLAVDLLVRLRARRPHGRAATAVQQLELNAGRVDRATHQPAERVDLADKMTLCRPADRGVARHVADRLARQGAKAYMCAKARRGVRRFTARVASANHDHIEG